MFGFKKSVVIVAIALAGGAAAGVEGQQSQGQGQGQGRGGRGNAIQAEPGNCPPGTTEFRVGQCRAPEFPPPSILDYKPRSTLVTKETLVPRARYPVVDIHSHTPPTPDTIDRLIQEMDAMGVRTLVNLSGGGAAAVKQRSTTSAGRRTRIASRCLPTWTSKAPVVPAGQRRPSPIWKRPSRTAPLD